MMNLTQKLSAFFVAGAMAVGGSVQAQNIVWGAGADSLSNVIGTFADAFNTPNGWMPVSVSETGATPGDALWTRTTNGLSQGAYAGGLPALASPSVNNGAALFDSDYMDNGGVAGAFGTGTAPSPHKGYLFSPLFDLSGYTDTLLAAQMYLQYRNFSISELSIGFSSDGGATWDDFDIQQGVGTNQFFDTDMIEVTLAGVTAGVTDLDSCQLRLTFDGDYYFAMIDDITLIKGKAYDITFAPAIEQNDYKTIAPPAPFAVMPDFVAEGYAPYIFGAMATNKGGAAIPQSANPTLYYDITMDMAGTWTSVLNGSAPFDTTIYASGYASVSDDITTAMQAAHAANGVGDYRITYWLGHDLNEGDMANDTMIFDWTVTTNAYSAMPMAQAGGPAADDNVFPGAASGNVVQTFEWGGLYYFPDTAGIAIDSVEYRMYASTQLNSTTVPSVVVTVNVYEFDNNAADLATAMQLRTLTIDTVPTVGTPGTYVYRKVKIVDPNIFNTTTLKYDYPYGLYNSATPDALYSVTLSQTNVGGIVGPAPAQQRNGFFAASMSLPYEFNDEITVETLTPLRVVEGTAGTMGSETWYGGFEGNHQAPSIMLKTTNWPVSSINNVSKNDNNAINVFPNPANNVLNVTLDLEKTSDVRYILTDVQGRVLNMQNRDAVQNDVLTLDVTNLPAGVYFMNARTDAGVFTKRFVKQ